MSKLVYPSPSKIHGTGAFAGAELPRDLHVRIPYRQIKRDHRNAFEGGLLPLEPFCYLNHSQRPNCEVITNVDRGRELLYLRVLKKIPPGTELTIDYGEEYWEAV
jgi:SET domain-containing protein